MPPVPTAVVYALQQAWRSQPGGFHCQGKQHGSACNDIGFLRLPLERYSALGSTAAVLFQLQEGLAYLFIVTANDKQWGAAESKLRTMLESFQA